MKAFKFIVREWTAIPSRPGCSSAGCAALVFAETVEDARGLLSKRNEENGSLPWQEVASVTELPMNECGVALLVEI